MLPRRHRLAPRSDLILVLRRGAVLRAAGLTVRILPTRRPWSRFAFVVSTKVAKHATVRNRIRRQLREETRRLMPRLARGYDVIVTVQPGRVSASAGAAEALRAALQRGRLLAPHASTLAKPV